MNAALRRMVRGTATVATDPPPQPRALRQAVTRAADRAAGLALVVLGVEVTQSPLEDLVPALDAGQLLVMIGAGAGPEGVIAIDPDLRGALIEMQTVGLLSPHPAPARDATTADLAMAEPFAHHLITELRADSRDTTLGPALPAMGVLGRFANARAVSLALPDVNYQVLRLSLDLGQPDRQGALLLALPCRKPAARTLAPPPPDPAWSAALARAVMDAPCRLDAVLPRPTLTLGRVEGFAVGQVLSLPGVGVDSVRIEGPGGALVGAGRLGQIGGMRAVRLGLPRTPAMEEMLPPPAT